MVTYYPTYDPPCQKQRRCGDAESGTVARAHSGRCAQGICRQGVRRRARGFYRPTRGDQQADALPLFGNKEGLFKAVLRRKITERQAWAETLSGDPAESLAFWFEAACNDTDWVRMLEWEALQEADGRLIDEKNRRTATARGIERIRQRQARGQISAEFDPRHVMLAMRSLTMFPAAFPQLTRLIMGRPVSDPRFQEERTEFLRRFAAAFRPAQATGPKYVLRNNQP